MSLYRNLVALALASSMSGAFAAPDLSQQVADTERAFAATMKARDHAAFKSFLADEAIFNAGPRALRGKEAIAAAWKRYYDSPNAPFSWEPDQVEVVASGTLAYTSGPVYDPNGKVFSRFNSVWRLEPDGKWRVVFDRGEQLCDCKKP
ncbi:YybH family protein [Massilia endophytica]|uniref:YybH family protein n=1 Tax=Massilia endophytica TaxID=2899220 RepID=UPI001E5287C0|nr:nuclear transport factor 2 family protein [Massilia endophytica]UGQ48423.1 nuclear transport factor 2 family protein [Massilia endophytica]